MMTKIANSRSGATVLEMAISMVIMAMLLGSIAAIVESGSGAYHQGMATATLETQARRALDSIARQFQDANRAGLVPQPDAPLGSETLDYQRSIGSLGGAILWGPTRTVEFRYAIGELDNGIDDNNDGLVDEGRVVLVENVGQANETTQVLTTDVREYLEGEAPGGGDDNGNGLVDERGLSFELVDETLLIRLTVEKLDHEGRLMTHTVETSVWIRN